MEDKEVFEQKKLNIRKKTRFYLYAGFLLLIVGVIWLYFSNLGLVLITGGIVMRVLYYIAKMDLKAIDRLEKRLKIILLCFITLNLFSTDIFALQPGQKAAEVSSLNWLKGEPVTIFPKDKEREKIVIVQCWASWDKGCQLAIPVLSRIQKKYQQQVVIAGISKEKQDSLNAFLNKSGSNISYCIAQDGTGSTVDMYTGEDTRIPTSLVIGKSGKVLWRGHPMELESVLKNIINGTFDLEKQKKISKLQRELQNFLQLENFRQVISTSEKILEIDPANDIAMRVRLFVFENSKQLPQALEFINKQISKNPDMVELYFIKLDLMQRNNTPVVEIKKTMAGIAEKFKKDPDALHQLAWIGVNRIQFGTAPLDIILKSAKIAVDLLVNSQEQDSTKLANFLNTLARTYYMAGMLEKAIEIQKKSCRLFQGESGEAEAGQLLNYYQEAIKVKSSEN